VQSVNSENVSPEGAFLSALFENLNSANIRYAVLRNYQTLPFSSGGSDLDLAVHPEDAIRAQDAIASAVIQTRSFVLGAADRRKDFFQAFVLGQNDSSWWGICIDVFSGVYYMGGAQLLENKSINLSVAIHQSIRVLTDDLAAVLGVAKELLHNGLLPPRYLPAAAIAVRTNWGQLENDFSPMGDQALALLKELCLSIPGDRDIASKARAFRRAVLNTAIKRGPISFFKGRFLYEWSKVRRLMRPSGTVVATLGTDGSGKSTVIGAIEPALHDATHGALVIKHLRPGLLPALARLKGGTTGKTAGPVVEPHGKPPSGKFGSLLRVLWLLADYILGYWLIVRPTVAKSPTVMIFDRYAYDLAIDPRRFRIGLTGSFVGLFTRFAPKPDLIICLHGDPAVIAARKHELPEDEVRRQTEALITFAKQEPRAVLVSTEGTVEQARDDVLNAVRQFCERRSASAVHGA
jgi:thymidylate kinase